MIVNLGSLPWDTSVALPPKQAGAYSFCAFRITRKRTDGGPPGQPGNPESTTRRQDTQAGSTTSAGARAAAGRPYPPLPSTALRSHQSTPPVPPAPPSLHASLPVPIIYRHSLCQVTLPVPPHPDEASLAVISALQSLGQARHTALPTHLHMRCRPLISQK